MSPNFWWLKEFWLLFASSIVWVVCLWRSKYAQQLKLKQDLTQDMFRYIFRRIPPPPKKKPFKFKRKKDSCLSAEVPAYRADKYKCLTKNSRHDLIFITDVRWSFQSAIDRFVINTSFFRSCPNGHKLTDSAIWTHRDKCILFLQI